MFVRKKKNKSGSISVQIIDKSKRYRVIQSLGSSINPDEIGRLAENGRQIIRGSHGNDRQLKLFSTKTKEELVIESFLQNVSNAQIHTIGPELIFGALFDRLGFRAIKNDLFRHIVVARLAYPVSKLKTADYLYRYRGLSIQVDKIYRFLDTLKDKHKEEAEKIAYEYTRNTLKNISIVFYDMTTLYFESEDEDDLRKIGFSKDGKFQKPQIMLGLLVGQNGYPIGYEIFRGNTFEGHTLVPTLKKIQKKYKFQNPIVVADAALLSRDNLNSLAGQDYGFVIGARVKNETDKIKAKILKRAEEMKNGDNCNISKPDGTRLIVTYSDKRARKDKHNRDKGLKKLRQKVKSGRLTKEAINNRGYNKFLVLKNNVEVEINEDKIKEDKKWDGLKGYVTNTRLRAKTIIENYNHLWQIEKAFRISKTDLKVRPIYHHLQNRIEAHICTAFVAYTIYKELERLLYKYNAGFSPKRAAELTHNMYEIEYMLPDSRRKGKMILKMDGEQQILYEIIHRGK